MLEKASEAMTSSSKEVGPTEDVIQALLDHLVDPMLPLKSAARETPSLSQQQSVAKQVHAVVLLYNYYQRKRHTEAEFLSFEPFCKLAITLKPTLMTHMKLMHNSDYSELDDLENQLSLTEKAIMSACDIALVLDASKDVPTTEGWPISKVAVLLVDSKKENCLLQFSSITQGVWSVIEKDLAVSSTSSEGTVEGKYINKRKRVAKKPMKDELNADEAGLQQLAYSAVKEATGITQADLVVLESHVVYSLSKEKTASRFYIVQCTQSINEDLQVPIKDAIESLLGPLVKKSSSNWMVTPVVEYFHVLPYAGIVSDWLSREGFSNTMQDLKVGLGNVNVNSPQRTVNSCDVEATDNKNDSSKNCVIADSIGNETKDANTESPKQKDNNGHHTICLPESLRGLHDMDVGNSFMVCTQNEEKSKNTSQILKVYHHRREMTASMENATINGLTGGVTGVKVKAEMVDSVKLSVGECRDEEMFDSIKKSPVTECIDEKIDTGNKICNVVPSDQDGTSVEDRALVPIQLNSKYVEKLQVTLASKENALSQTALRVLLRKRDKLSRHLRNLEDEIALCDKHIETILDGGEDDLALKIEAIIDGCNDVCLKSENQIQESSHEHFEDRGLHPFVKKKRLSEAILTLRNPCQELDDICYENNWRLPTYRVSPSDGGFLANVIVKGMDFEFSGGSDLCSNPREARDSAAAQMIAKLQSTAGQN